MPERDELEQYITAHRLGAGRHALVIAERVVCDDNPSLDRSVTDFSEPHRQGRAGWRAVKVVIAPRDGTDCHLEPHNIKREVGILRRSSHPNVILCLGYHYDPSASEHRLHMPLLQKSLRDYLQSDECAKLDLHLEQFSGDIVPVVDDKFSHGVQTLSLGVWQGLAYLHSSGIAHRDIKPENIMLDWDGKAVLIDFGTAWKRDEPMPGGLGVGVATSLTMDIGTGPYRAPELLFGITAYDPMALDLWSFACVLAEIFRGRSLAPMNVAAPSPNSEGSSSSSGDQSDSVVSDLDPGTLLICKSGPLFDASMGALGLASSIFSLTGTPNVERWPSFDRLPDAKKFPFDPKHSQVHGLRNLLPRLRLLPDPAARIYTQVLSQMLALEPARRRGARDAARSVLQLGTLMAADADTRSPA